MRVLEVSLRKAGFSVTTAVSVQDGIDKLELHSPDLIISETAFPDGDGFELRRRVRATTDWSEIPFIFLTAEAAIESKIKGLELGVDDYLTKPIYIKEIVTRINILLQKRQRARFEERRDGRTRFAGRVSDMPVVDVIQTIEVSRKSGVIQFVGERGRQATIYFRDGNVIDAESGSLQGEDAVYRLLTWNEGEFEVVFRTVRRRRVIETSSQGLLMEGMRRLDEWSRLLEQLPPVTHRFEVDAAELAVRLGDVPDDNNGILRLIDGKRTLLEVIDASAVGDLECLQAISRLYFEEMILDLDHDAPARRDTGKPMPLVEMEASSPIHSAAVAREPPSRPSSGRVPVTEADVLAEYPAPGAAPAGTAREPEEWFAEPPVALAPGLPSSAPGAEVGGPGALRGAYRPSSLRLIDEAVAAAQAIEPSLFDDMPHLRPDPPAPSFASEETTPPSPAGAGMMAAVRPITTGDDSVPRAIVDEASPPSRRAGRRTMPSTPPPSKPVGGRSEDSGLRMIGSHGRDRAEASGELGIAASSSPSLPVVAGQRELITIMPRRSTREIPIVTLAEPPASTPPGPAGAGAPDAPVLPRVITRDGPRRDLAPGGTVIERGPGAVAKVLFALAAILLALTLYLWIRDGKTKARATLPPASDPGAVIEARPDAPVAVPDAVAIPAGSPDAPASVLTVVPDADVTSAGVAPDAPDVSAVSPESAARLLREQAEAALAESDPEKALALADASNRIRRTARAFLARAQALQRLDRIAEAVAATRAAEEQAPDFASIYDLRGNILWSAGRRDEAKTAYARFLALEPAGEKADRVRRRLEN